MRISKRRTGALVLAGLAVLLMAGGIAYATIPDSGGVYTACRLNNVGTIRLIDPSGPSSSLLSHCTSLETQIQWNAKGQAGAPGATGPPGPAGPAGTSPTVTQLTAGDSHCPSGGASITDANGTTAYVCNGQNGAPGQDGKDFAGTFTSPNGSFSLSVADDGVHIVGPDSSIGISSDGTLAISAANETITVPGNRTATIGGNENITISGNRTESVTGNRKETVTGNDNLQVTGSRDERIGSDDDLRVSLSRTESVGLGLSVRAGTVLDLRGSMVQVNAGSQCLPVARQSDLVDTSGGTIVTGSATVCSG
jgi:hypothetical protein